MWKSDLLHIHVMLGFRIRVFSILMGVLLAYIKFDDLGFTTNMLINIIGFVSFIFGVLKLNKNDTDLSKNSNY